MVAVLRPIAVICSSSLHYYFITLLSLDLDGSLFH